MASILQEITTQEAWEEFLAYRLMKGRFDWRSFNEADSFVETEGYLPGAEDLSAGGSPGIPQKKLINKMGSEKKRAVYCFDEERMRILKLIAFLLYRYDGVLCPNCYSFRRGLTAQDAILSLRRSTKGKGLWAYKVDIHDYFNSIDIPILLSILAEVLSDDVPLLDFFRRMLSDGRAYFDGKIITENHGIMAGTPTSPFLADIYLKEVDRHFFDKGVTYARYSDDIILFAPDEDTLNGHIRTLHAFFGKYRLAVNPEKERIYRPGEPFEFLGFSCLDGIIGVSNSAKRKMKDRIKRKARSLRRWGEKKGVPSEVLLRTMIKCFNRKFYDMDTSELLTWSRWFFPVINDTEGLKEIDHCLQDNLRFLSSGKHNGANFRVRYKDLKSMGYRSLVHEYYLFKEESSEQ